MCNDAADPPWWPTLETYDKEDCFTVQVAIDGTYDCPISGFKNGLIALTPVDTRPFDRHIKPWRDREVKLGMIGGIGHTARREIVQRLQGAYILRFEEGPVGRTYDEMAEQLCNCKGVFNYGATGSGARLHVKGRVVEAGFAGAALFELKDSPTKDWFTPGVEYFEYEGAEHLIELLSSLDDPTLERASLRLFRRMNAEHHPLVFWAKVLAKCGLG